MDRAEFEADHKIDPLQLDLECTRQPELFFKWAERLVEAKAAVDQAKYKWDVTEAKLALDIRSKPGDYGLTKTTEPTIAAAVKTNAKYKKARERWLEARGKADMLEKAVGAMEMKKRMLESLITLHGQQYFAGPSTPRNLGEAWLAQKEAAGEEMHRRQVSITRKRKKAK